jgi:hypothetical protein
MALGHLNPISLKRGGIFIFPELSSVRMETLSGEHSISREFEVVSKPTLNVL